MSMRRSQLRSAILACALLAGFACRSALRPPQAAAESAEPAVVALEPYVGRLRAVRVRIGGEEMRLLFDTGGGLTSLNPAAAARIGCTPAGRTTGFRMSGERLESPLCPGVELAVGPWRSRLDVGVFDLAALLPKEFPPLDGILGLDAFDGATLTLDLAGDRLTLETPASAARRIAAGVELRVRRATIPDSRALDLFVACPSPRGDAWLLLDSANLDTVRLAPHAAALLGVPPAGDSHARLAVAGLAPEEVEISIHDSIYDGALNQRWIAKRILTLDLLHNRAWSSR